MLVLWIVLALAVVIAGYVRLAPSDPVRWHRMPEGEVSRDMAHGVLRVVETGPDGLARLDTVARATPRTKVLAGSVEEGMVTYVTRSAVFGFPDYATAAQVGDTLKIYSRLRFGRSDSGVNKARVEDWLRALQP